MFGFLFKNLCLKSMPHLNIINAINNSRKILIISFFTASLLLIFFYYFILFSANFFGNRTIASEGIISQMYLISMIFNVFLLPLILIIILFFNIFTKKSKLVNFFSIISVLIYFSFVIYSIPSPWSGTLGEFFMDKNVILLYLLICLGSYSLTIIFSCLSWCE